MKQTYQIFALLFVFAISLNCMSCSSKTENIKPDKVATKLSSIEDYMKISFADSAEVDTLGNLYYLTISDGLNQLHRITNNKTTPELITSKTFFPEGIDFFSMALDGSLIVIGADTGGDEQFDLYLIDPNKPQSKPQEIDIDRNTRVDSVNWSQDASFFSYRSTRRTGKDFDIYHAHKIKNFTPELAIELNGYNWVSDISSDNSLSAIVKYHGGNFSEIYLSKNLSGEVSKLTSNTRTTGICADFHFINNNLAVMLTDDNETHTYIATIEIDSGKITKISHYNWSVEDIELSPDKKLLSVAINENGITKLEILEIKSFKKLSTPKLPDTATILREMYLKNTALYFAASDATKTVEVWKLDFTNMQYSQQTHSYYAGVDVSNFIKPELVFYKSFDGRMIPAFLYRPKGYDNKPAPVVIYAHGGPESQFRPGFIRNFQYLLERGIGVLAPNVRGSSGYGSEFITLDDNHKRMDSIKDFKAAADWLVSNKIAAPDQLGVMGGSYGGFVVMALITEYPELFKAAINKVGIVNFVTFLQNTKGYRRVVREREYGQLTDIDFLKSISPIYKIDRVKTPLLIMHGENDPRVPVGEARQIISALKSRGQMVEAIIFPDEGHGVSKEKNRIIAYKALTDFLVKYLLEIKLQPEK